MKNELRDSALWAVVVSFLSAIAVLTGTITTAILNRKSKDKETEVKADADIRDDRKDITDGYRQGYQDCREELRQARAEIVPLRRRADLWERRARQLEDLCIDNSLLCRLPTPEPSPAQAD